MATKPEQLPLPDFTIEVKKGVNTWEKVDKLPPQGRVKITSAKRPPRTK